MDLQQSQKNPFKVHGRTEKLLVLREREREFHDFNKLEKEGQHVHEKEKTSRPNRQGVIREIRNIKTSKSVGQRFEFGGSGKDRQLALKKSLDENANKPKHNIFDLTEAANLQKDYLEKIGYDQQPGALVKVADDNRSVSSHASKSQRSALEPINNKPKAIEYLLKGNENKESVKDFINFSR